jgi:hypothetical protein
MKTIKQILEQYDTLTNKKTNENQKLVELVREGLLDESKLPLVETALTVNPELMTVAEHRALVDLLENLSTFFMLEKKTEKNKVIKDLPDKMKQPKEDDDNYPTNKQAPAVLVFQRKAIRLYPDNLKVAVYYSAALDKYISIPFGPKSAEANLNEAISDFSKKVAYDQKVKDRGDSLQNSWDKKANSAEDKAVTKHTDPRTARVNAALRNREKTRGIRSAVIDRASQHGKNRDFAAMGKGGFRAAAQQSVMRTSNQDPVVQGVHLAGKLANVGARKVANKIGQGASWIKNKISAVRQKQADAPTTSPIQEASPFIKSKPYKPVKQKKVSFSKFFSSSKKKSAPKPKKESSEKKTETKSETKSASPAPKKEDLSSLISKYRETAKRHAVSTGTNVKVFDSNAGKHVDRNSKEMLGDYKESLAKKIRSAGGEVPSVETPKKRERDPNRKPPPALAQEGLLDVAKRSLTSTSTSSSSSEPTDRYTDRGGNRGPVGRVKKRGSFSSASEVALQKRKGEVPVAESHLSQIKSLVESDAPSVDLTFGEHQISINNRIGKKLLTVYESLNKENKQKVARMLDESVDSFRKVINFVVRQ